VCVYIYIYIYVCVCVCARAREGAGWVAILEGHSHLCGVERRLGLVRGVTLVLELFAILDLFWLGVSCNLTSLIKFVHR
jgi:hypothetical protein